MMPSQIATFRGSAAQCFSGIIALTVPIFVCLRLNTGPATTAFIYLAVIVLLSLFGNYFASVVLNVIAVAAAIGRPETAPKSGLAATGDSSIMA
jgi:hypothetical protein